VSAARDEILAQVRAALGAGSRRGPVPRTYRTTGSLDEAGRIALLERRLLDYRAQVERTTAEEVQTVVDNITRGRRIGVPTDLRDDWRPANAVEDRGLDTHELDALDGVVTSCTLAIAETGTLVLSGGKQEGRRALTLVPDLHICVVAADQIVETVPEAFAGLRGIETCALTFVSGPSATSDIELERVEGVHGPRTLAVIIVNSYADA
jgi:L-lactate dehydrogenase complex protein LldG